MSRISIALITDNNYVLPTAVTIASILKNQKKTTSYDVYVLGVNISPSNKLCLEKAGAKVISLDSKSYEEFIGTHPHVSIAALAKFDLSHIFHDLDKILYLDTDMIILKDLSELYNIDLGEHYAAVVKDMAGQIDGHAQKLKHSNYFNSGMMLLNLKKIRADDISKKLVDYKLYQDVGDFMDQDCLNAVFNENVIYMSPIYNWMAPNQLKYNANDIKNFYKIDTEPTLNNAVIVHLTNKKKVWNYINVWGHDLWMEYYNISEVKDVKLQLLDSASNHFFGWAESGKYRKFFICGIPVLRKKETLSRKTVDLFNIRILKIDRSDKLYKMRLYGNKNLLSNEYKKVYICGIKVSGYIRKKIFHRYHGNKIVLIKNGKEKNIHRIRGIKIQIRGNNNTIKLTWPIKAKNSSIAIKNDNVQIEIGSSPKLSNLHIDCSNGYAQFCKIGSDTIINGLLIKLSERSGCIIGDKCLFSTSVVIWASDGHSVLDNTTKQILNTATQPVVIGNHAWIGEGVKIAKRTKIHDNSIVSMGSVCSKDYIEPNVVIAGNPAQIVKTGVNWERSNPYQLQRNRENAINNLPHVNRQELDEKISGFKSMGISDNSRKPRVIVSLTSFPQRIHDIHYTIFSILNQTMKPDMVVLWLGEDRFPEREKKLPQSLLNLTKYGLTIKWCRDIRSYTKLVPSLLEFPDDIIITVDDDIYYSETLVENLYNAYVKHPEFIHCGRAHQIMCDSCGTVLPYKQWKWSVQNVKPSFANFLTGVGGVLYPPHCLDADATNQDLFMNLSPRADDIWFWAMAVRHKTKINVVDGLSNLVYINPERELQINGQATLLSSNVNGTGNDEQMAQVLKYLNMDADILQQ